MAAAIALGFGGQFAELKNPDDPRRMRIVSEVDALGMVTVEFCGEEGRVELHQSSFDSVNIDCKNRKTGSFATLGSDLAGIPIFTAAYDEVGSVISNSPPTEAGVMTSVRLSNPDWRGTELQIQLDTYDAFISFGRNGEPALVLGAEKTKALADAVSGKR